LASFLEHHPDIRVEVEEQLSGDIVRALVEGLADVGVFAENTPTDGLNVAPFRTDQLVLVCAKQHPIAKHKRLSFKECLAYDFVVLDRGSSLLELISRAAERASLPLRLRVQVRSFDAMCQMIGANLGIGVLPLAACRPQINALGLRVMRLVDGWATRRLLAATKADRQLSAAAALLRDHLISVSPNSDHRSSI
jgi:DNA-binding transcriptional LysR family regulator